MSHVLQEHLESCAFSLGGVRKNAMHSATAVWGEESDGACNFCRTDEEYQHDCTAVL